MSNVKVVLFAAFIGLMGCSNSSSNNSGGGNPNKKMQGIDKDGNCSPATVKALNSVSDNAKKYMDSPDMKYVNIVMKSCAEVRNLIGASSCKWEMNGNVENVSYKNIEQVCSTAADLQKGGTPNPGSPGAPGNPGNPGNPGGDPNACGNDVVESILNIGQASQEYMRSPSRGALQNLDRTCDVFLAAIGTRTCSVKDHAGNTEQVSAATFKADCDKIKEELRN